MKIAMIAPYTGGIDVYLNSFVPEIRKLGHEVDILGSVEGESAYDQNKHGWKTADEVVEMVRKIKDRINFSKYDIVAFHYGKNDIEMLIPTFLDKSDYPDTKFVYYVHYLSRNLFKQYIPNEKIQEKIEYAVYNFFDGYIFFGLWAKNFMQTKAGKQFPGIVSFIPEAHSQEHGENEERIIYSLVPDYDSIKDKVVFLPGFAANYKDQELLLKSFEIVKTNLIYYFAGPGWRKRIPTDLKIGNVEVRVLDKYLTPLEYKILTQKSVVGIFPYRQPNVEGEYFQGSGTIPNFIYFGKASVALNEGTVPEMIGDSGIIVEKNDPEKLAGAIDQVLEPKMKLLLEENAQKRAYLFSARHHAEDSVRYFEELLKTK